MGGNGQSVGPGSDDGDLEELHVLIMVRSAAFEPDCCELCKMSGWLRPVPPCSMPSFSTSTREAA